MKAFVTAKVGVFLVISSVLAVWMLLATQSVQAHTTALPSPTCSNLPDDAFFTSSADIVSGTPAPSITTQQGVGSTTREMLRYGKIMIPALAAGELRVHSTTTPSDAVLCRGTSTRATSRTNYSAHNTATSAATTAAAAADRAAALPNASVISARTALNNAATALTNVANALEAAGKTTEAGAATTAAGAARAFAADTATNTTAAVFESELDTAAGHLTTAANALHAGFQIRAEVRPGDESYVLVVAVMDATADPDSTLAVQFHGAIESTALGHQDSFSAGQVRSHTIAITAPGLLTLEEKGSTDTMGTFGGDMIPSGGSAGNFTLVKPVEASTSPHVTLLVEGLTPTTAGDYTLDMEFEVAMPAAALTDATGVTAAAFTGWGTTAIDDDTTLQIDGSVIGGGASADEDYFLFTPDTGTPPAGFLTIAATNATGASRHSNTAGTLYGPDGEIAMDADSGTGNHFSFRVPVDNMDYLVKVTGTTGQYALSFTLDGAMSQGTSESRPEAATVECANDNTDDGTGNIPNEICARGSRLQQERDRFLLDVVESGALYVHSTGSTDTVGTLYGPDGREIATDDNSGQGTNFRIATNVDPGLHIVEVRGQNSDTQGAYGLVTNFVTGAEVDTPTPPVGPVDPPPTTVDPDPAGVLEEPPSGGVRSGIGLIRGWVCQDAGEGVQISITNTDSGAQATTFTAPYGSDRGDVNVSEHCADRIVNGVGFAVQYNYNLLPAGTYTIQAFVGGERVGLSRPGGQTNTFTVARISDAEFLARVPSSIRVLVEDFPVRGTTTILEFDLSSQNFEIVGTQ